MQQKFTPETRLTFFAGALFAWAGIGIQLFDTIQTTKLPVADTLINFFSYFTILTNLLVALYFTAALLTPDTAITSFLRRYTSTTAIAVYILVVGIIYNVSLRSIWTFTGWGKISNELLHTVTPIYFLIFWFLLTAKEKLPLRAAIYWMFYPLLYLGYTFIRGSIVHRYPYPFIDVTKLGYAKVMTNCFGVAVVFFLLFIIFITAGNRLIRN